MNPRESKKKVNWSKQHLFCNCIPSRPSNDSRSAYLLWKRMGGIFFLYFYGVCCILNNVDASIWRVISERKQKWSTYPREFPEVQFHKWNEEGVFARRMCIVWCVLWSGMKSHVEGMRILLLVNSWPCREWHTFS